MHFNERINALKSQESNPNNNKKKEDDKNNLGYRPKVVKPTIQPFDMMQTRFGFTKPEVKGRLLLDDREGRTTAARQIQSQVLAGSTVCDPKLGGSRVCRK